MATLDGVEARLRQRIEWVLGASEVRRKGKPFWVTEGFRPLEEQWRLYNLMVDAQKRYGANWRHAALAAYPGTSMHGKKPAMAVDLACEPVDNGLRAELAAAASLVTPIEGEPWHMQLGTAPKPLPPLPTKPDEPASPKPSVPPAQRPTVTTEIGDDNVRRLDIHVPSLDDDGFGWVEVDGRYDQIVGGILAHGNYPPADGYSRQIPRLAAQDRGGKTIVEIHGLPRQEIFFGITFAE